MGGQATRNTEVMKKLGKRLRLIRVEKNLSQEQLAYKCGLAHSQITLIETGQLNTTISTIYAIAKALGVKTGELCDI